jgi:hypothetical protein
VASLSDKLSDNPPGLARTLVGASGHRLAGTGHADRGRRARHSAFGTKRPTVRLAPLPVGQSAPSRDSPVRLSAHACRRLSAHCVAELSRIRSRRRLRRRWPGVSAAALPWRPARRTPGHTRWAHRSTRLTRNAGRYSATAIFLGFRLSSSRPPRLGRPPGRRCAMASPT